jgi:hypothetical protein
MVGGAGGMPKLRIAIIGAGSVVSLAVSAIVAVPEAARAEFALTE